MSKLENLRIDGPPPRPQRNKRLPWVPIVVVLFALLAFAWLQRDKLAGWLSVDGQGQPGAQQENGNSADNVIPATAASGPPGSISAAGYLEVIPPGPAVVSTLVSGRVEEVLAVPGETVAEGDVLATLDASALRQRASVLASRVELAHERLKRLEAGFRVEEIAQAQSSLERERAVLERTRADYQRADELYRKGVISRAELDFATSEQRQAEAAVAQAQSRLELLEAGTRGEDIAVAEAEVRAGQAELDQLYWEISQCTIRAPRSGVVLEQHVYPGDWVTPGTDNPRSGAIVSVFDPAAIQAWVDVNQRDSGAVVVGQRVEMVTDAQPQRPINGTVKLIMPRANLQKNTVQAKIAISDPPPDFRPELSVKVTFLPPEERSSETAANEAAGDELEDA